MAGSVLFVKSNSRGVFTSRLARRDYVIPALLLSFQRKLESNAILVIPAEAGIQVGGDVAMMISLQNTHPKRNGRFANRPPKAQIEIAEKWRYF